MPVATPRPGTRRWGKLVPWLFVAPWIFGFIAFTVGPLLYSLYMSLFNWPLVGERTFVGLHNYSSMLQDEDFLDAVVVTLKFAALYVPVNLVLSLLLAMLLNQKVPGQGVFRTLFYLPSLISTVALVTIWSWAYSHEYGILNYLLSLLNIPAVDWLGSPDWAMRSVVIAGLWGLGGTMLIFLAGLKGIPSELHEAAILSGAGPVRRFFGLTLPLLSPVLLFNLVTTLIAAFQQLALALLLTKGGPLKTTYMVALYIYDTAFKHFEMGYASAMSWAMFVVVLLLSMLVMRFSSMWVFYEAEVKSK